MPVVVVVCDNCDAARLSELAGSQVVLTLELGLENHFLAQGRQPPPFLIVRCIGVKGARWAVELGRRALTWQPGGFHGRWVRELLKILDHLLGSQVLCVAGARRSVQVGRWATALGRSVCLCLSLLAHSLSRLRNELSALPRSLATHSESRWVAGRRCTPPRCVPPREKKMEGRKIEGNKPHSLCLRSQLF